MYFFVIECQHICLFHLHRELIAYIETTDHRYRWHGWLLVCGFFGVTFLYSMFFNQNSYRSYNISMKIKAALTAAVYRKVRTTCQMSL